MHAQPPFFAEPAHWVVLSFVLFFLLFGRKLWLSLTAMLDARTAAVRAEMSEATRLRAEAEAMLKEAEATRSKAEAEAKLLIGAASTEAARVAEAARNEAEAAAARREQIASDRIAAAQKHAVDEVRTAAVELATIAARQVIGADLSAEARAALMNRAIAQLPSALNYTRLV
jgi:F-type H+-transporting ATPase subunit b